MKVKLRDVSNVIMGQSPDSSTYNTKKIGLPFFQGNADFGELNPIAKTWCSAPIKIAYKNYILISVRAPIGALNIAAEKCCIGRGLAALDVNNKMCTQKYLWYLLKAKKNELLSKGTGSTFKAISKNILSEMEFNIPPVREQELCTKALDVVFYLIRLKKEQLDKLDLLVKSRFIEMFVDPIKNSKGLPLIRLGDYCYLKAGVTTPADTIHEYSKEYNVPCYGGNGIRGYVKEATQSGEYPIIGRQGALCGNVKLATGIFHATEHAVLVKALRPANTVWLYFMLMFMDLYRFHTGAAQPGLAVKTLNTILVPEADVNLQNQFADFVAQVDKSKFVVTAKFQ